MPDLCGFMTSHISLITYSFNFHKCSDVRCCGVECSPSQFQVLATQSQPTPRLDKDRGDNFLSRTHAQARVLDKAAFNDLEDMPSDTVDTRKAGAKIKARRDENSSKAAGIIS